MKYRILLFASVLVFSSARAQTAEDLFNDSPVLIRWLGIDFSHVKVGSFAQWGNAGAKGTVTIRDVYFSSWNRIILSEPHKYDVWAMMRKTNLMVDIDMMLGVNERTNLEDMQTYHVPNYDMTKIQEFVSTWPLEGKDGIGIAFIAEALDKREAKAYFHFVAVNLRTKQLLLHQRVVTSPAGMGLRNYWAGSIYKAIKLIEKKYYRRWRKELS